MKNSAKMLAYVFLGGALGTMLRYLIFELIAAQQAYPLAESISIFVVNMAGSFFLGLTARHPWFQSEGCRNLWGLGFAGGFTTMSAITLLVNAQGLSWEIALMLFSGVALYGIGFRFGQMAAKGRED
jgi:fluoride exporter